MTGYYIDSHNHLGDESFGCDIDEVIRNAQKVHVAAALVCAESVADYPRILQLAVEYPSFIAPCLGIHPVQKDAENPSKEIASTIEHLREAQPLLDKNVDAMYAVGEVGLDFQPRITPNSEARDIQREVFKRQVKFAISHALPVNVHSRSAGKPTIAALKECNATNVLLHAFDGRPSAALEGVKEGYYFSIPPSVVRSEQKQKLVKTLPLDHLLLETDSPALGPEKTCRNVPENITIACQAVADIKNITPKEVQEMATSNALKLFPKLKNLVESC